MTLGPVTISDLMREGKLLWVYCITCGREKDVHPALLDLPRDTAVPGLGRRHMKCTSCVSREIDTRPELYPGGIDAIRRASASVKRT